jgi:predicted outer membrane protein
LVAGYALAQQQQGNPGEIKPSQFRKDVTDREAIGQNDRSATQQGERSATQRTTGFRGTPGTAGSSQQIDQYLAKCLLTKNQGEVELAKIAQQQSENPEVKQFAEMLVKDHSAMVQKLQPLAGGGQARGAGQDEYNRRENATDAPRLPGSPGADQTRAPSEDSLLTATAPADASGGALMQLAAIEKKIHDQCLQAMKEELQQKTGAEFDECFVGGQVGGHIQMVAALEVIGQETQGQLQEIVQGAQPKTQQHLEHAKQLAKQLKSSNPQVGQAPRQPTRTQR